MRISMCDYTNENSINFGCNILYMATINRRKFIHKVIYFLFNSLFLRSLLLEKINNPKKCNPKMIMEKNNEPSLWYRLNDSTVLRNI